MACLHVNYPGLWLTATRMAIDIRLLKNEGSRK